MLCLWHGVISNKSNSQLTSIRSSSIVRRILAQGQWILLWIFATWHWNCRKIVAQTNSLDMKMTKSYFSIVVKILLLKLWKSLSSLAKMKSSARSKLMTWESPKQPRSTVLVSISNNCASLWDTVTPRWLWNTSRVLGTKWEKQNCKQKQEIVLKCKRVYSISKDLKLINEKFC